MIDAMSVVIRAGDTLILVAKAKLDDAWVTRVKSEVDEHLPGVKLAVVDRVEAAFVYRPSEAGTGETPSDGNSGDTGARDTD